MSHADPFADALAKHRAGQRREAEAIYRAILQSQPDHPDALHYLGLLSYQTGRLDAALELMRRAVALRPDVAHFHGNLGNALRAAGRPDEAIAAYQEALRRNPGSCAALVNLGNTLWEAGRPEDALRSFDAALRQDGRLAEAHGGAGLALKDLGLLDEALAAFDEAIRLASQLAAAESNRLYTLNYLPGWSPQRIFDEHRAWAIRRADPLSSGAPPAVVERSSGRRLRLGYVSAHFRDHAVNFFVEPILASHQRDRFEVFCYSDVAAPDAVTKRLMASVEHWRSIVGLGDVDVAQQIRDDGIDILVDLAGHLGGNRLLAFARRPAPIQVTYLGYQATTGLAAMDYRLTDAVADPPGATEAWHTEQLVRLPGAFFCYRPPDESPEVSAAPCLASGTITFGSFNAFAKVTTRTLDVWARVLERVAGSRLQLLAPPGESTPRRVLAHFARRGIAEDRLRFVTRSRRREYLAMHHAVDIALDSFPFTGHTTTCDALWMGVPVVTLCGASYTQRFGASPLVAVGLEELVATSEDEYVARAVELACDPGRIDRMRRTLRERMRGSALLDFAGFTAGLERVYEELWHRAGGA